MKLKYVKSPMSVNRGHTVAVALSLGLLFCLDLEYVGAQLRAQKRITWVWTATDADGSRVTVASDGQLNDYEAYTRGNRFYVKIPAADLPSKTGSLLGRGFDDVQIQRMGDGIMLSFRLQPGTTAHVNQKLNRIELVFSIPTRSSSAGSGADRTAVNEPHRNAAKGPVGAGNKQNPARDERGSSPAANSASATSPGPLSARETRSPAISSASKGSTARDSVASRSPWPSGSPIYSPSPYASTSSSPSVNMSVGTQALQTTASASPTPVSAAGARSDWSGKLRDLRTRVRNSPWLSAVAALALLGLLLLVFVGRKRPLGPGPAIPIQRLDVGPSAGPVAAQGQGEVPSESPGSSPVISKVAHASEDPEREVFEL